MRRIIIGALGLVLLGATLASAQPDVGIKAPAPVTPSTPIERPGKALPGNAGDDGHRGARYAPAFIGPTAKGETTEFGFSGWIAPSVPEGSTDPRGDDGWAAFGFTLKWGGAPRGVTPKPAKRS